jgi:uncharacterized protein (TIGR02118 family)
MPSVAGLQIDVFEVEDEFMPPGASQPGQAEKGADVTKLRGTWHIPNDATAEEIDSHYFGVHVPNVRGLPKLARHVVLKAIEWPEGTHPRCWRGAETWANSHEDFDAQIDSTQWKKIEADGFMPSVAGLHIDVFTVEEEWVPAGASS